MPRHDPETMAEIVRHILDGPRLTMPLSTARQAFERRYFFKLMLGSNGHVPTVTAACEMSSDAACRHKMQTLGLWPREVYEAVHAAVMQEKRGRQA